MVRSATPVPKPALQMADGKKVLGYQLDANGNMTGDAKPLEAKIDPSNGLYMGKYNSVILNFLFLDTAPAVGNYFYLKMLNE